MIEAEKKRQAYIKKIDRLPIDDSGKGGDMTMMQGGSGLL